MSPHHIRITFSDQTAKHALPSDPQTMKLLTIPLPHHSSPPNPTFLRFKLKPHSSLSSPNLAPPKPQSQTPPRVLIIGAGLAGLAAATHLNSHNIPFLLLEASDDVGGRVRTDAVDGFLLDRGFQIFITAYPEARKLLDYETLNLNTFYSGARIFHDGRFHVVADPLRSFFDSIKSLANPIGSVNDKLLIGLTRLRVMVKSDEEIFASSEASIMEMLMKSGFSDSIIARFFQPFFGGVFFDRKLETSSRLFDFIFKCLALGDNTLPSQGIAAIPRQLAGKLPPGSISLNSKVASIDLEGDDAPRVRLESGEKLSSELGVIVAVEQPEADKLLAGKVYEPVQRKPARSTVCLYFSSDRAHIPVKDPVLFLNGSGNGIVNNMFFATNVAPSYGPPDKALVSVSLVGEFKDVKDEDLTVQVVREMSEWFGESVVGSWRHLRTYRIKFAQPNQSPPLDPAGNYRVRSGVYMCGDHVTNATFDGALVSGRRAVEALLRDNALNRVI